MASEGEIVTLCPGACTTEGGLQLCTRGSASSELLFPESQSCTPALSGRLLSSAGTRCQTWSSQRPLPHFIFFNKLLFLEQF